MADGVAAPPGSTPRGRRDECAVLDALLDGARAGRSGALVVRGDAGNRKTALLEYVIASAADLGVMRAVGVESERELAFAALHQLGLPELPVGGLEEADARELLRSVVPGRLDDRIREQVIAEARGNPLALLELTRGLSPAQLAGGFGLPGALSLEGRIQQSFLARVDALPEDSRRLLLVAAAEPTGDPALVWRAARRLGITAAALGPAESAGLLEVGARVRFRHPLVRSAVYLPASPQERRDAHRVLAEATDAAVDPDRRAWHLAEAAPGPDEEVAAELERAAGRAQARGGA